MAENKVGPNIGAGAGIFAKRVQKSLNRAQEKVLQKLGKNMETRDEQFEQCSQNLLRQQTDGGRLLKDVRAYFTAVKAMHESSRRLSQTLKAVYEPDWQGGDDLAVIMDSEDLLWNDYEEKLTDQLVRTMENYTSQFHEVKERVAKRGRKLVDYDSSRHHLEALQGTKKKDEAKITKAEEEFNKAQGVFEELNSELREELPVLYQSRIGCYVTVFQNISNLRDVFYKEMSVLNHDLYNVMKKLETQHSGKAFIIKGLSRYCELSQAGIHGEGRSSFSSKSNKKRKSLVISAPIPCNTAFPANHTSLHSASDQGGTDPAAAAPSSSDAIAEEPADAPTSPPPPAEDSATPSEASDPEEPRSRSNGEKSDVTGEEGRSRTGSAVREERPSSQSEDSAVAADDGQDQGPEVTESGSIVLRAEEGNPPEVEPIQHVLRSEEENPPEVEPIPDVLPSEEENRPEAEPILDAKARAPPVPAPRLNVQPSQSQADPPVEASHADQLTNTTCAGDDSDSQHPPGFLYKALALEGVTSEGQLQFKEGDVILVLADAEEQEGMLLGVREDSWIQHRDLAHHSGIFSEKLIRPVQSE